MSFVCVYILKKTKQKKNQKKKNSRFPKFSQKKRKIFQKKSLWTRGIEPLSHLKKNFFELGALDFLVTFLVTFSKKTLFFFSYKYFKILKSLLFKMVHEDPLDKNIF